MIVLSGTAIFWCIALGLTIGWVFGKIIKKEGISVRGNMIWGIMGSVASGSIAILNGMGDGLLFAFIGTLAVLFLANVFHQHHLEDFIDDEEDYGIKIIKGAR